MMEGERGGGKEGEKERRLMVWGDALWDERGEKEREKGKEGKWDEEREEALKEGNRWRKGWIEASKTEEEERRKNFQEGGVDGRQMDGGTERESRMGT